MIDKCFSSLELQDEFQIQGISPRNRSFAQDKTAKSKKLFDSKPLFSGSSLHFSSFFQVIANFIFLEGDSVMFSLLSYQIVLS